MATTTHSPAALEGGVPACLRLAIFEGWQAAFVDRRGQCHDWPPFKDRRRFAISLSKMGEANPWAVHPEISAYFGEVIALRRDTDDPEEAERLWAEACEKLREMGD